MKLVFAVLLALFSSTAFAQAVCTRVPSTTLRKGPGPKFEKSWTVTKYMPFLQVDSKDGWLKLVDMDGEVHWGRGQDFTRHLRCVAVRSNTTETRQGPGPGFPYGDFKTIDRYTPLKRLNSQGGWLEVENDLGMKAWVQESRIWHPVKVEAVHF